MQTNGSLSSCPGHGMAQRRHFAEDILGSASQQLLQQEAMRSPTPIPSPHTTQADGRNSRRTSFAQNRTTDDTSNIVAAAHGRLKKRRQGAEFRAFLRFRLKGQT